MAETPLRILIQKKIEQSGPMPFRDFMELALYHSEHGYYASGWARIGRGGDFFTNVSVGALFGQFLAEQFCEMWERLGRKHPFTVVEQGANSGDFANDVLRWARDTAPDFLEALRYIIVEPFSRLRERQAQTLGALAERVTWRESLAQVEPFCGVHFSNELLDAFPVHLVRCTNGEWRERHVTAQFHWIDFPVENRELTERLTLIEPPRIENYTTEINLDALAWIDQVSAKIERGWVIAIDYGYPRDLYYSRERTTGTLSCHAKHRRSFDPLENIGETDITAHVDFTSLAERAEADGLTLAGFTDQHHFIVALAKHFFAERPPNQKEARALQTLMHPQFLGAVFKVLALEKNPASSAALRGFEFASDAKIALGLR